MARTIEFITNHWILVLAWAVFAFALFAYLRTKSGKTISTHEATLLINRSKGSVLDIREKKAFDEGHIVDAINIPLSKLQGRLTELSKKKQEPLIVVCQMGHQSGDAVKMLEANEFAQVSKMYGGMQEWQAQNLPAVKA